MKAVLDRPIEGDWPYLWIDATYVKVSQDDRIVSVAVIVAVSANSDAAARRWAWILDRRSPYGPPSCASWLGGACAE